MTEAVRPAVLVVPGMTKDLGGFAVQRVLPAKERRAIGPFVFFDHIGPAQLAPGVGVDVRPHPHIGLATCTYLFAGELVHRDSLGSLQPIRPGAINWMVAGRGIVHSERTDPALRAAGAPLHGLQVWIALPRDAEEAEPSFSHHPEDTLPVVQRPGAALRVLVGAAYGARAPAAVHSPLYYVDARLDDGAQVASPDGYDERGAYVIEGCVRVDGVDYGAGTMLLVDDDRPLTAIGAARVVLLGGARLDGPRRVWWNFVSSSPERLEQAKRDWRDGRFPKVPGDDVEFIPLPE